MLKNWRSKSGEPTDLVDFLKEIIEEVLQEQNHTNTFYNGKQITRKNLLAMIQECIEEDWEDSHLRKSTEEALEKIYYGGYEGREADIQLIINKLNSKSRYGFCYPNANLQDVEIIISEGQWYFQD